MFKSGFVSILGRTNVGKSSIVNKLVGEKVAAVANKTQTTRTAIKRLSKSVGITRNRTRNFRNTTTGTRS